MKQKIVIKVQMRCGKCRKEAMKIAASAEGVISVTMQGKDKDEIVVVGNEVDSAGLCAALRKKVGISNLLSVEEVKDPKPEEKKKEEKKAVEEKKAEKVEEKKPEKEEKKPEKEKTSESKPSTPEPTIIYHHYPPNYNYPPPNYYGCQNPPQCYMYTYDDHNPSCSVM
ncbi:heavy metal-associated isoprenylated plant protein 47 [Beta vulgaris subsp. vulgaris]|uniref:heavy metal-associated isoprenylated plant protein 47 n=1 Tax=Beta vulgaris subsp. vulgaris TaxID=3555 RepID=UPI0020366AD0|nr:heavy metal-associated isoprenylated plant protein 47 [Beta vulgaris subsp. vulgaris]